MGGPRSVARSARRGFALIGVLWASVLLAIVAGSITGTARTELRLARDLLTATRAELAADGALWTAVQALRLGGGTWRADGTVYAWTFAGSAVAVRITDETGRIDINAAPEPLVAALMRAAGEPAPRAAETAAAVAAHRTRLAAAAIAQDPGTTPPPPFPVTEALRRVPGVDEALWLSLRDAVTVHTGQGRPLTGLGSPLVRAALVGEVAAEAAPAPPLAPGPADLDTVPAEAAEPAEKVEGAPAMIRVEAEAIAPDGSHFARLAVIALAPEDGGQPRVHRWHRGDRRLFAPDGARP